MKWAKEITTARAHLSQAEAARAIWPTLSVRTVQDWESGRREPPDWVQGLVLLRLRAAVKRRKAP